MLSVILRHAVHVHFTGIAPPPNVCKAGLAELRDDVTNFVCHAGLHYRVQDRLGQQQDVANWNDWIEARC